MLVPPEATQSMNDDSTSRGFRRLWHKLSSPSQSSPNLRKSLITFRKSLITSCKWLMTRMIKVDQGQSRSIKVNQGEKNIFTVTKHTNDDTFSRILPGKKSPAERVAGCVLRQVAGGRFSRRAGKSGSTAAKMPAATILVAVSRCARFQPLPPANLDNDNSIY